MHLTALKWLCLILGAAYGLRWSKRHWPSYHDALDSVVVCFWVFSSLIRLDLLFTSETNLPFHEFKWRWIVVPLFVASFSLILRGPWRRVYASLVVMAAVCLTAIDITHFQKEYLLWSPCSWSEFIQGAKLLFARRDWPLVLPLVWFWVELAAFCCVAPLPVLKPSIWMKRWSQRVVMGILLPAFFLIGLRLYLASKKLSQPSANFGETAYIHSKGIWEHHLFLVLRDWTEYREGFGSDAEQIESVNKIRKYAELNAETLHGGERHFGIAKGENVIVIQASSLTAFVIGSRILGQEITPFLNSFRKKSLYFPSVLAQMKDGGGSDTQYIAMTSLHPLPEGAIVIRKRHEQLNALPQILRQSGYFTFSAHMSSGWHADDFRMQKRYGFMQSIFHEDLEPVRPEERIQNNVAEEAYAERIGQSIGHLQQPFFAYVVMMSADVKKMLPKHLRYLDLGPLENTRLGRYFQEMRELDEALHELVDTVQNPSLKNSCMIVIYGNSEARLPQDLDLEAFLGLKRWTADSGLQLKKVPLMIFLPKKSLRGDVHSEGGQVDMAPTILSLLGINRPINFVGTSLLDAAPSMVAFQDGSVYSKKYIYVPENPDGLGSAACWDSVQGSTVTLTQCNPIRGLANQQLDVSDQIHRTSALLNPRRHLEE